MSRNDALLPDCDERHYLRGRCEQELAMTLHAQCLEAELIHNRLTGLYLRRCLECCSARSEECRDCPLREICQSGNLSTMPVMFEWAG